MPDLALEIIDLIKMYGSTPAVRGVSFSIKRGEFFGFLGPNGAGKTTTINCITGIATPSEGTVRVFGIDAVTNYRETRRLVGLSPQEFNVDIFATTREILHYIAGFYGIRKRDREPKIEELLKRFELTSHAEKQFRALSGGLKRRGMLARAMVHDPDLLILDEPTAGVDVQLRHDLWRFLREINAEGKTILLTSHYLEEVEMLCGRIAIIHDGKIIAIGDKSAFISGGKKLEQRFLELTGSEQ